ncbi:MAG: hypothetical protein ACRDYV_01915 [Acidimicrobiia bacterium]
MTWILAAATVMVLSSIAVGYRHADRDRCRAAHPTAREVAPPLRLAVNGTCTPGGPTPKRRRHLEVVQSRVSQMTQSKR